MVDRNDLMEAVIIGFWGLTLGSLAMFIPTDKKDKYLVPFVGIFMTGFVGHLLWKQFGMDSFGAALVGGDRHIGGFGDISTGGTNEFNQIYINEELTEDLLITARGLGLDFTDQ